MKSTPTKSIFAATEGEGYTKSLVTRRWTLVKR
jgi:hypothetical protein